jgi:hypothetical protein
MSVQVDVLSILCAEYKRVADGIRQIESSTDRLLTIGVTVVVAGVAYGIERNITQVFLLIPAALAIVFLYSILQYSHVLWMGGYNRALEDKINETTPEPLLIWERSVNQFRGRIAPPNIFLAVFYFFLLVGLYTYSAVTVIAAYNILVSVCFVGFEVFSISTIVLSLLFMKTRYKISYVSTCGLLGVKRRSLSGGE